MNKILIIKSLFIAFIAINIAGCKGNKANLEAEMYNIMGMNALQEGNYEQAADYFKKGKNSGINDHYCYILNRNIAQCYMNIQQTDSAKKYAFLSTKCCKKNSYDYLVSMADIDLLDNKIEAAKDKLTYAVAIKSQDMIAYNMLGLIYLGDYGLEFQNIENAVMYNRKAFELNHDRITEEVLACSYVLPQLPLALCSCQLHPLQ